MKKIVFTLLAVALVMQPADAQFYKKLFKKKAKTEKKTVAKSDGINDDAQLPMADIASCVDNTLNRNAFIGIPLGIKADRFEQMLLQKGFEEQKHEGRQTAKSYIYEGDVYGVRSVVTLAVSDQTARVYAVDVADGTVYASEQAVRQRFQQLKGGLCKVYGRGFVDNQGEAYTIMTRLGTVSLHYERASLTNSFSLGFALDDAKAYQMAYSEMDDKEYEAAPRYIERGLAAACRHTDLVGLGVKLLQNRSVKMAQSVLQSYDYTMGKANVKVVPASFVMGDYRVSVSLARKKNLFTSVTMTAADDVEAVCRDLATYGFTSSDRKTWRQGKMTFVVSEDKQGMVVLVLR